MQTLPAVLLALALSACSSSSNANAPASALPDASSDDATSAVPIPSSPDGATAPSPGDADSSSTTAPDAAPDAPTGGADPTDILGTLTGACPIVTVDLHSTLPSVHDDTLTFVTGESYERTSLSAGAKHMFDTPNAGGSSVESEVMSLEVLHYCEQAELLKTETEIGYDTTVDAGAGAITDLEVSIHGEKVGVSVTRVYQPNPQNITVAFAKNLLEKKLGDIVVSSARVTAADRWVKQILHVFAPSVAAASVTKTAVEQIASTLRGDTIVLVTATPGGGFIYCKPAPPLGQDCPVK